MNNVIRKASIITVCYNARHSIRRTIESVLGLNTLIIIDYIVIDGGSNDGTIDIINEYLNNISYFVSEKDAGIYDAMNKGIRAASGDIIGFINAGDYYPEYAIEDVANCFNNTKADVVYGDVVKVHDGQELSVRKGDICIENLMDTMIACHQAVFIKTALQKKHEFDTSYSIAADRKVLLTLFLENVKFVYIEKIIAFYDNAGISSTKLYESMVEGYRLTYETLHVFFPDRNDSLIKTKQDVYICEFWHDWESERNDEGCISKWFNSVIDQNKRILIWGTGVYGEKAEGLFSDLGYEIAGFIDSYLDKKKKTKYKVLLPCEVEYDSNTAVIVASRKYANEIVASISSLDNLKSIPCYVFVDMLIEYEKNLGKTVESILYGIDEMI